MLRAARHAREVFWGPGAFGFLGLSLLRLGMMFLFLKYSLRGFRRIGFFLLLPRVAQF